MRTRFALSILCALAGALAFGQAEKLTAKQVYERCRDSVVSIEAETAEGKVSGTGFFFENGKTIATCLHVVRGAKNITIKARDGDSWLPTAVTFDEDGDTALLRLGADSGRKPLAGAAPGTTSVGDPIFVIGDPLGLTGSLSTGVVGQLRKEKNIPLVQITAPVSEGSSGSPVIDESGHVIGMVSYYLSNGQNVNMAVNAELAKGLLAKAAMPMSRFETFAFKDPDDDTEDLKAAIDELDVPGAKNLLCYTFALAYDDLSKANQRWNIAWYLSDEKADDAIWEMKVFQDALVAVIIDEEEEAVIRHMAKRAGADGATIGKILGFDRSIKGLGAELLDRQTKWIRADAANDTARIQALNKAIYDTQGKILKAMGDMIGAMARQEWSDLDAIRRGLSSHTQLIGLFNRFDAISDPDEGEEVTVAATYEGSKLKEGDVVVGIGLDKPSAPFTKVVSPDDLVKFYYAGSNKEKKLKLNVRRGGKLVVVHEPA